MTRKLSRANAYFLVLFFYKNVFFLKFEILKASILTEILSERVLRKKEKQYFFDCKELW